jgi:hypothetical protein
MAFSGSAINQRPFNSTLGTRLVASMRCALNLLDDVLFEGTRNTNSMSHSV